jgi:aryl-alcohol dehydrogenase-like predicted oxidoreductase
MERRSFLKTMSATVGAGSLAVRRVFGDSQPKTLTVETVKGLPRRALGNTNEKLSVVGFPGLALRHHDQAESTAALHKAFDLGLNYYDVAPAYGKDGECEIKMGVGLQGLNRDDYFLACKTKMRDKDGARMELERSLERLKTDRFDLYQLHCLKHPDEVKKAFGPNGAMETVLKAKEEGKFKYIGFSAHTTKGALAAMREFQFDTVMFPINWVELFTEGIGQEVLDLAAEQGASVLAIKALCRGQWPENKPRSRKWWYHTIDEPDEVGVSMRFVLSQSNVIAGIPPSFVDITEKAIAACHDDRPISKAELRTLKVMAKDCRSLFRREEDQVAYSECWNEPQYPNSPHECGSHYA